jgi:hypothetical protein
MELAGQIPVPATRSARRPTRPASSAPADFTRLALGFLAAPAASWTRGSTEAWGWPRAGEGPGKQEMSKQEVSRCCSRTGTP